MGQSDAGQDLLISAVLTVYLISDPKASSARTRMLHIMLCLLNRD